MLQSIDDTCGYFHRNFSPCEEILFDNFNRIHNLER
jgi:hypothetical protein